MSDPPFVPASLYGLRTWRLAAGSNGDELLAAHQRTRWPPDGAWLHATCNASGDHEAPADGCSCGIHAWHPRRATARRVLASRFEIPGIVEAAGAIELQEDGFRAERARPYAFVVTPGRNASQAERLARRYDAQVAAVGGADGLLAWCRDRGIGMSADTVGALLGPDRARERQVMARRARRKGAIGIAAVIAISAVLLLAGGRFESGPPGSAGVYGKNGWVDPPACPTAAQIQSGAPRGRAGC